jgi:UDP-glucuronate decarboxylase
MKILITGVAGLIGSHLAEFLINQEHTVFGVDNLLNSKRENIPDGVEFLKHDIETPLPMVQVDQVYHLACPASPVHYQRTPIKTMMSSVLGTYNILNFAYASKAKFLYTSSSEVYGDTKNQPINELQLGENIDILADRSCYVEGKRASETLIWNYIKEKPLNVKIARLFNVYGPRMAIDDGRVVANFIHQRPIQIHGTGEQKRSFTYVDDCVEGLVKLMECDTVKRPINIGNPSGYISIVGLAKLIFEIMEEEPNIEHIPDRSDLEVFQRMPDISEAIINLKWTPNISLVDGIEKVIKEMNNE